MNSKRDKILFLSLTNGAGGAEQILLMAAKVTESRMIFLKEATKHSLNTTGLQQKIEFLTKKSLFIGFILLLKELVAYRKDYIIISSHPYLNAYLGILKRLGFIKSKIVTRESTSVFLRFTGLKRLSYKVVYTLGYPRIDLLICQTDEMKHQLLDNFSFLTNDKVIVLENPIDMNLVLQNAEAELFDPILKENYICSAGRLISLKGFDLLIKAFAKVVSVYPDLKLLILGEGEERLNLNELIIRLNLQEKVILKGFVKNPFPYFKEAQICIVSSSREGFPNVLLQMMALNKSVISTLCAGGIEDFETIRKVEINSEQEMVNAIKEELSRTHEENINQNRQYILARTPENFINSILINVR